MAQSDGRPVGDEPAFSAAGSFVDVYTSADSAFSSILVQICSDRLKPNSRLYWWNGAAWATVSPAAEYSAGPPECLTFTATSDSEPSVDQLTGTVFVAGTKTSQTITFDDAPPSAEYGSTFRVNPMATSGLPVSLGGTEGVCSVAAVADGAGFDVTMLAETGVCDLTTSQAGNDRYEAAPDVTRHVAAEQAAPKYRLSISLIMADYCCEK